MFALNLIPNYAIILSIFTIFAMCIALALLLFYKKCPSNKVLVVYGRISGKSYVKCYHGGGRIIWPIIQGYDFLDLTPRTIHITLKGALSLQNIRINVPSTITVAVDVDPQSLNNAAMRLLGLTNREIESMAIEIITGQMRLTVASLTIEQINQDRERFLEAIKNHIAPELGKIGLTLINVNITDITDESQYIDSIGKKAASLAINNAKIDVSKAERDGETGKALADKDRRISVATYNSQAVQGENEAQATIAFYNADLSEKNALAEARSKVAEQNAEMEIQTAKAFAEHKRLEAEVIIPQEIKKRQAEIEAEAIAEKVRREARGKADSILALKQAEATGIRQVLESKAEGYKKLIEACGNNAQAASTMLMIEKLEKVAALQTEAIKNLKIDKITVWDSGDSEKGSSTANFMSSMIKSLPALHEVASMAGIDLPKYLGSVNEGKASSSSNNSIDSTKVINHAINPTKKQDQKSI